MRPIIAISGGKDSAYTAWLVQSRGENPMGVMIDTGFLPLRAHENARRVCNRLDMPLVTYSFPREFKTIYRTGLPMVRDGLDPFKMICHPCHALLHTQLLRVARRYESIRVYSGCGRKHETHMGARIANTTTDDGIEIVYPMLDCGLSPSEIRRLLDRNGVLEWDRSSPLTTNCRVCHAMIDTALRAGHGNPFAPYFLDPREPEAGWLRTRVMQAACWLAARTGLYRLVLRGLYGKLNDAKPLPSAGD